MHFFTKKYQQVSEEDVELESNIVNSKQPSRHWISLTVLLLTIFATVAIGGASYTRRIWSCHIQSQPTLNPQILFENCGSSPTEARSRGCRFDVLSFAWQVPECYDEELINKFLAESKGKYYRDAEGQQEISQQIVARGETDMLFVPWEFHVYHCKYMWTQMHQKLEFGRPLDSHLSSYEHTVHCGEVLMEDGYIESGRMATQAPIIYPTCYVGQLWQRGMQF